VHESNTPIFTGFVDVFFNCMLPRIIPTNDETNRNKIIIAATQINFQPFSTIPNKPLCARIGITGNITSAFDSTLNSSGVPTLNPAGIPALDPAFDDALFP